MEHQPKELHEYRAPDGRIPFKEWLLDLRDQRARWKISVRLKRLAFGHYGDCRFVGEGVFELRIHEGPGYRVYFGQEQETLILLLCAGDKHTQAGDILKARAYWADYGGRP